MEAANPGARARSRGIERRAVRLQRGTLISFSIPQDGHVATPPTACAPPGRCPKPTRGAGNRRAIDAAVANATRAARSAKPTFAVARRSRRARGDPRTNVKWARFVPRFDVAHRGSGRVLLRGCPAHGGRASGGRVRARDAGERDSSCTHLRAPATRLRGLRSRARMSRLRIGSYFVGLAAGENVTSARTPRGEIPVFETLVEEGVPDVDWFGWLRRFRPKRS